VPLAPRGAFTFHLHVVPTSTATWGPQLSEPVTACRHQPVPLPLHLDGEPPFTVRYRVRARQVADAVDAAPTPRGAEGRVATFSWQPDVSESPSLVARLSASWSRWRAGGQSRVQWDRELRVDGFAETGAYEVVLLSVTDAHGCETQYVPVPLWFRVQHVYSRTYGTLWLPGWLAGWTASCRRRCCSSASRRSCRRRRPRSTAASKAPCASTLGRQKVRSWGSGPWSVHSQ